MNAEEKLCAELSRQTGRPVKPEHLYKAFWFQPARANVFVSAFQRRMQTEYAIRVDVQFNRLGTPGGALIHRFINN